MKSSSKWNHSPKSNLILWNEYLDSSELLVDFYTGEQVGDYIRHSIIYNIKPNYDYFYFVPVCYRQPNYMIHERNIMNQYITTLEDNMLITDCEA